jgi:Holliday junction resolvase RusA-like endonuclease
MLIATWPTEQIRFRVPGAPRPLMRPRFSKGRVYNPSTGDMRDFLRVAKPSAPRVLAAGGPLSIDLEFVFARPASHLTKAGVLRASAPRLHTNMPDVDNLVKLVLDALNGEFYRDDRQVIEISARKRYTQGREPAGTDVCLSYGVPGATNVVLAPAPDGAP